MRSKYVGKTFGDWTCTTITIANVSGKRAKRPGTINYRYTFERATSDGLAKKSVQLNSTEAVQVYRGTKTVEAIADRRRMRRERINTPRQVQYSFID